MTISGEKEKQDPTKEVETPSKKPASGEVRGGALPGDSETGGHSGVYHPLDDITPPHEIPVDFSDTEYDILVKEEPEEEQASSPESRGAGSSSDPDVAGDESCAEEGGVPHDILSLYGGSSTEENEAGASGDDSEAEETTPDPGDAEEEPDPGDTGNLEAPEELIRRVTKRFSAKLIDFLIAAILYQVPGVVGPVAAVAYICLADGISGGSPGKRAAGGLRVVSTIMVKEACDFRDSILRNSIFGILVAAFYLLGWIPYFGKLIVFVVALAVVAYEASLLYKASDSTRIGDTLAGTRVIESGAGEDEADEIFEPPEPRKTD